MESARILIIEDNHADAKLIEHETIKFNSSVITRIINSLDDLIISISEFSPNIILSDFDLRSFNAFDVLNIIENSDQNIPCVIVTGVINDEETVARLVLKGAVGFIQKKNMSHLKEKLHQVLVELDNSFSTNFEIFESKLELLHRIRKIQFDFNQIVLNLPELSEFNTDFSENMEDIIVEIEGLYKKLPLLKGN